MLLDTDHLSVLLQSHDRRHATLTSRLRDHQGERLRVSIVSVRFCEVGLHRFERPKVWMAKCTPMAIWPKRWRLWQSGKLCDSKNKPAKGFAIYEKNVYALALKILRLLQSPSFVMNCFLRQIIAIFVLCLDCSFRIGWNKASLSEMSSQLSA
jgi:hypothetical protein